MTLEIVCPTLEAEEERRTRDPCSRSRF